jgi:glycosyltransferase involved in cell wall biosynthesis
MRILLINHYAGSVYHGMEFRPYYMSREWVKMGHNVTIVAASFSHLRQKNIDMEEPIKEEYIDGIRYVWLKTPAYHGNGIGRIKNMLSFLRKLYKFEKVINKDLDPDVVIASSTYPLDSYPANWIAKKHKAKFVFELHDLWPMSPMVLSNMSKWHPFIMVMQKAEDYWCKNADLVVSLLPDAYKHLVTRGMSMDKYVVIPNGISLDEWGYQEEDLPQEHINAINKLKGDGKFIVGYLGGHAVSNGLNFLLETADILREHSDIHFVLVGKGTEKDSLINRAPKMGLSNITFLQPVPKTSVPNLLTKMDVLVFGYVKTPLGKYGSSENKFFDYMMSCKPIIKSSDVSNDMIKEAKCGYSLPPGDIKGFADKILYMKSMDTQSLSQMGLNGREYVLKNFTYDKLAQKFIDVL